MVEFGPATFTLETATTGSYSGYPLTGRLTSTFGAHEQFRKDRGWPPHGGNDIAAAAGAAIRAAAPGLCARLSSTMFLGIPGHYVVLAHPGPDQILFTRYAHMLEPSPLVIGQEVQRGDVIGKVGASGKDWRGNPSATGPHLHWDFGPEIDFDMESKLDALEMVREHPLDNPNLPRELSAAEAYQKLADAFAPVVDPTRDTKFQADGFRMIGTRRYAVWVLMQEVDE